MYLSMTNVHMDTPANHIQIANGGKFLNEQCEKFKKDEEKKEKKKPVGESKVQ